MATKWTPEQEAAMSDHGKTMLVSAAAGSGKTSVLTERIIRSLTDPEYPADLSRMLIVTFTRASAADLKSKIAKALTKALATRPGDPHLTKQLLSLGSAQISTIDSFFQKVVRANFDVLDLPAAFRIADTTEAMPLCMRALNNLLEDHYTKHAQTKESANDPLARMRGNAFAEAMDHLLSGRSDGKLEALLLEFYDKFSSYPQGIGLLHTCAESLCKEANAEFFTSRSGNVIKEHLLEQFRSFDAFLVQTKRTLEADPDLYKKFSGILSSDIDFCNAILHALENNSYTETRQTAYTFVSGRFPTIKSESTTNTVLAYKTWRTKFKDTIVKKVQPYLQWPAEAIPSQFQKTASLCEALYRLYVDYEAAVLKEKKARGILEYNDIRSALYRLLTLPDGTPSPTAKSIAAQYDAVYIDEYQDVDFLQDSIFAQIGGNRRFMVGDIKQSIYVFRGSEPSVFAGYRRTYPLYTENTEKSDGVCVFMSNNFRCNEPVIQFTNKICSFLFSACEKSIGYREQDDLVFSKSENPNAEPVHVAIFDPKPQTRNKSDEGNTEEQERYSAEAAWIANEILRLLSEEKLDDGKAITPADIAILVRAKSHGIDIARALETLNIPVIAEAANNLMEEPLMIDLLNLLRAIDNPYRDIPLSEYLLSDIGGFTLEELTEIRSFTPDCKALYDALVAKAADENDFTLGKKATDLCKWLEDLREQASTLSADRFLRLLYLDEKLIPYQGDPVLLYLYEQARIYQRTAFCGLYAFLDAITKIQSNEKVSAEGFKKAEKAVTIMTVHHSKGLEYPVVFLSASGKHFNKDDMKKTLLFHRNVGCASKLYNSELGEVEDSVLRVAAKLEIEAEQTEESIRTLYVALTRARERLYVTGTLSGNSSAALSAAELIKRYDRSAILGCNSYLTWILAALQEKENTKASYTLDFYSHIPVALNESQENIEASSVDVTKETASKAEDEITKRYTDILQKQADFSYPLSFLRGLPTKAAASKLSPDLLDRLLDEGDESTVSEAQLNLMLSKQPSFDELLLTAQEPSAADIGTVTHAFLQFCNFKRLSEIGVEAECAQLVSDGFISKAYADIIHRDQLNAFVKSDLMQEILSAKNIRREQQFNLFVPFCELTTKKNQPEQFAEHALFVQGSIDLLIETVDSELLLVDYKTDHITKAEQTNLDLYRARLRESHKNQLSYYKKAVEQLFSKPPDKAFIYSLPLGELIDI